MRGGELGGDDALDVVGCYVEVVQEDEEGDDDVFRGKAALDGGLRVAFVAHLALDHADEVGAEDAGHGGDDAGDDVALRGGEGALDDLVDDVHDVVDGGGDVGSVGRDGPVHVEGDVGGLLVELEGFFDGAAEVEGRH